MVDAIASMFETGIFKPGIKHSRYELINEQDC